MAKNVSTKEAEKAMWKSARSTQPEKPEMTPERALLLAQDIVRFCDQAGLSARAVNVNGGMAIILTGCYVCQKCQNFSQSEACQRCASLPSSA